ARESMCRHNLAALAPGHPEAHRLLEGAFAEWARLRAGQQWLRDATGNVLRRTGPAGAFLRLADDRGAVARLALPSAETEGRSAPWLVDGLCPPWLFARLSAERPRRPDGHQPAITLVQADPLEFLDALAMADLAEHLRCPRLRLFVGPDALGRAQADLHDRPDHHLDGYAVATPGTVAGARSGAGQGVEQVLRGAATLQHERLARLGARVDALYQGRDPAWWARRYQQAGAQGPPLRVLILSCRYTTFVRHSGHDLADALARLGCSVRVLMEPDDSTHLSASAYLSAVLDFEPDLAICVNYHRQAFAGSLPAALPFVCWIQDAMAHLFTEAAGKALGPLDFTIGHLYPELFAPFRYPRARTLAVPVVACARKFAPAGPRAPARRDLACDVAYVSHQSQTPEALHAQLLAGTRATPGQEGVARLLGTLEPGVREVAARASLGLPVRELEALVSRELTRARGGQTPPAQDVITLVKQYAEPLAERIVRHQTLAWAADAARRRGWSLKIFGRGWEDHPSLSEFAAEPLEHGDELRAGYQAAGVHLHMSLRATLHQRVLECVLAGGRPICRFLLADLHACKEWLLGRVVASGAPPTERRADGAIGYAIANHPELLRLASLRQRFGLPIEAVLWLTPARLEAARRPGGVPDPGSLSIYLLGESEEAFFAGPEELERRIAAALERPASARARSALARDRVIASATYDSVAASLLGMIRRELAEIAS
ncbi:MAG TPA: hypothetical protein VD963_04950, partial [Phycisphaerales bacterium]|nr:hypothetical protein [Phycisphaerales bacterium]